MSESPLEYTFNSIKTPIYPHFNEAAKQLVVPFIAVDSTGYANREYVVQAVFDRNQTDINLVDIKIAIPPILPTNTPTPSITPSNTVTPTRTPTCTPTPTNTPT
jgi:hypothetical protein